MKSYLGKVSDIFVCVVSHFLKWSDHLIAENIGINVILVGANDLGHTELDVWNIVFGSFEEDWDNVLGNLFFGDEWHHCSE